MEEEKERWWENREQESENDREKRRRRKSSYHTQNHTAMKSERENMEAARQVLSKSVSCNWETGDYHWGPAL